MNIWLAFGAAMLAACGKAPSGGGGGGGTKRGDAPAVTDAFTPWMPGDAAARWQGAWSTRMSPLVTGNSKDYTTGAGDPVAVVIAGDKATVWAGGPDVAMAFSIVSPCHARFDEPVTGGGAVHHDEMFVVDGAALVIGTGAAGYRKGKTAIVCSETSTTVVDDTGTCQTWESRLGKLEAKPGACAWSQTVGKDVLTIGAGDSQTVVQARGGLLESDQFADTAKLTTKATDLADAKAQVTAALDKHDPAVHAKNAGGVAGKTDTIMSLTATLASDRSGIGKLLTMTGVIEQSGTMTINGLAQNQTLLVDVGARDDKIDMLCIGAAALPAGVKTGDTVAATGRLQEAFGRPELEDCTVVKK